jgi:hypothetical protein
MEAKKVLEALSPQEALVVLEQLVASDTGIRKKAEEIALELLGDVDVDEVAEEVLWELDSIPVEEVWDRSGRTRNGYVDPGDCAWQLFEDALAPFTGQLEKCQELSLTKQAKLHCMGILKGIHRFETESTSEFKSWCVDAPGGYFVSVYQQWKKQATRKSDVSEVKKFIHLLCPEKSKLCS